MRNKTAFVIIAIVIILLIIWTWPYLSEWDLTPVRIAATSKSPARNWKVVGSYANNQQAAKLLAKVHARMIEFMRYLKKKYHIGETDDIIAGCHDHQRVVSLPHDLHNMVNALLDNYDPDQFFENDPRYSNDTSYTVNKGQQTYLCLRDKIRTGELTDEDTLFYCLAHEMGHQANYKGFGHKTNFWEIFKWLLWEAETGGFYKPIDYKKNPVMYCGLLISFQPLLDPTLKNLWEP